MSLKMENDTQLRKQLSGLPREIEPRRDAWPGIEARLGPRGLRVDSNKSRLRGFALAASVAVAFTAGLLLGRVDRPAGFESAAEGQRNLALLASVAASEREYQAAFQQFISVGDSDWLLTPDVRDGIERSWLELQSTERALIANGYMQGQANNLGRIDNTGRYQVFVLFPFGVKAIVAVSFLNLS